MYIVKIKVNSIAQILFAPTAASSFDFIFFLLLHWVFENQSKRKSEKKVLSNNMKHSVYLLLYKLRD